MGPLPYDSAEIHPLGDRRTAWNDEPILAEPVAEPARPQRVGLPVVLYVATCFSTYAVGGPIYAAALMFILTCHEFGHYLQARRYHVPASLPFFIPLPLPPLGTMGAVIGMRGNMGNRKSLFDIGISGPLAGLGPALMCSIVGLRLSSVVPISPGGDNLGEPLLFKFLAAWLIGPLPEGQTILLHPLAFAGWVGIFITGLNLFPISQLDGGHVLYALLRKKAHIVATALLFIAIAFVLLTQNYGWLLMLFLLVMVGPNHPPTGNDDVPLGTGRTILGWLSLSFVIIGFTPTPFTN
jgi:membrane-associated protease RseP (regulator of RpoE activity)